MKTSYVKPPRVAYFSTPVAVHTTYIRSPVPGVWSDMAFKFQVWRRFCQVVKVPGVFCWSKTILVVFLVLVEASHVYNRMGILAKLLGPWD